MTESITSSADGVSHHALGIVIEKGFIRSGQVVKLFRQCNTCGMWFPEVKEYFFHDGKSKSPETEWQPEGYCKECRNSKSATEKVLPSLGKDNHGVAESMRKERRREGQVCFNSPLLVLWHGSYPFERGPWRRDRQKESEFQSYWLDLREKALNGDTQAIREFKDNQAEFKERAKLELC